jgi:membrane-associated PAP2 superfamily phosphatase
VHPISWETIAAEIAADVINTLDLAIARLLIEKHGAAFLVDDTWITEDVEDPDARQQLATRSAIALLDEVGIAYARQNEAGS